MSGSWKKKKFIFVKNMSDENKRSRKSRHEKKSFSRVECSRKECKVLYRRHDRHGRKMRSSNCGMFREVGYSATDLNHSVESMPPVNKCRPKKSRKKRCKLQKVPKSSNPFILFYLKMLYRCSNLPVTKVARLAGKRWCSMSDCEKKKYIKLAKKEKKRRSCVKVEKKSSSIC